MAYNYSTDPKKTYYIRLKEIVSAVCVNEIDLSNPTTEEIEGLYDARKAWFDEQIQDWKDTWTQSLQQEADDTLKLLLNEIDEFTEFLNAEYRITIAAINKQEDVNRNNYVSIINEEFSNSQFLNENNNHLWSWFAQNNQHPLIVTKLGIGVDWQTLLDEYRPHSGRYGLRILISGRTRPTEEEPSVEKTEEVFFTNEEMYGNTYGFYEPYVQQKIFDISGFLTLSQINIFFWQDHDFKDQYGVDIPYEYSAEYLAENGLDSSVTPRKNIIVSSMDVFLGLTTDECKTDRVFLWTYDNMQYAADPAMIDGYTKTTRDLKMAWVHITENGPVLVDHYEKDSRGDADTSSLQYWYEQGKAAIHWYHYELGCAQDATKLYERQGGINWKHIEQQKEGLVTDDNGEEVAGLVDDYVYFDYTVTPDVLKAKDQWKVGVMLNNHMYMAEPLIFSNADKTVASAGPDTLNEVTFRLLRQVPGHNYSDQQNTVASLRSYDIIEDNNIGNFYVYDENGKVLKNDENVFYSDVWYYIQVWIRNNDTNEYSPMTYDPDNGLDQVEWRFPPSSLSMISQWDHCTADELSGLELGALEAGQTQNYRDQIDNITRRFKINSNWVLARNNNTITATVTRKKSNKIYHPTILLDFGENGTMGSDYTIILAMTQPEGTAIVKNQQFQISGELRNRNAERDVSEHYLWSWKLLSPTIITAGQNDPLEKEDGTLITPKEAWNTFYNSNKDITRASAYGYSQNVIKGFVRNEYPPIFEVTVGGAAGYDIQKIKGFRLTASAEWSDDYLVSCADRVEFKSDGSVPFAEMGYFSVLRTNTSNPYDYLYPQWELKQFLYNGTKWNELNPPHYFGLRQETVPQVNLDTNNNPIIYCTMMNDGSDMVDLTQPLSRTKQFENQTFRQFLTIQSQIAQVYQKAVNELALSEISQTEYNTQLKALQAARDADYDKLYQAAGMSIDSHDQYAFDPYIQNISGSTTERSTWMWDDSMKENYYMYIGFGHGGQEEIVGADGEITYQQGMFYRQAVPFTQNVYSSSLLNSWDGSYYFDESNGYLAAQLISAGTKDSQNTFTGVLMGNWHDYANSSLSTPGIYGMNKGQQAFGFKTDGTGFIGANAHGRIEFDGNQALISNADKSCYINLDPITYTYANEEIALNHYVGSSYPYFLYAEAKKSTKSDIDSFDKLELSTAWVNKYMLDSGKDYFIVDPNNGVLTTGAIIARYGKIGNWLISSQGLYQKYVDPTGYVQGNRFMYLGYPGVGTVETDETYRALKAALDQRKALDRQDIINNILFKKLEYIRTIATSANVEVYPIDPLHYYNDGWAMLWVYQIIQNALELYIQHNVSNDDSENRQKYMKQAIKEFYGKPLPHTGYHWHYPRSNNQYSMYTYAQSTLNRLIQGVKVSDYVNINATTIRDSQNDPALLSGYVHEDGTRGFDWTYTFNSATSIQTFTPANSYYADSYYFPRSQDGVNTEDLVQMMADESWSGTMAYRNVTATATNPQYIKWCNQVGFTPPVQFINGININVPITLTDSYLNGVSKFLTAGYAYSNDAYGRMLAATIESVLGDPELDPELKNQYEEYVEQVLVAEQRTLEAELENAYADRYALLESYKNTLAEEYYKDDKNRFAIWCGYTSPSDGGYPLFSVNWRGFMTSREALIGYQNPWLITDYGLTQTNNFGTIFLGNPEAPYNISKWVTGASDSIIRYNSSNNTLEVQTNAEDIDTGTLKKMDLYSLKNESDTTLYDRVVILAKIAYLIWQTMDEIYAANETARTDNKNILDTLPSKISDIVSPVQTKLTNYLSTTQTALAEFDTQIEAMFNSGYVLPELPDGMSLQKWCESDKASNDDKTYWNLYKNQVSYKQATESIELGLTEITDLLEAWGEGIWNEDDYLNLTNTSTPEEPISDTTRIALIKIINTRISKLNSLAKTANTTLKTNINPWLTHKNDTNMPAVDLMPTFDTLKEWHEESEAIQNVLDQPRIIKNTEVKASDSGLSATVINSAYGDHIDKLSSGYMVILGAMPDSSYVFTQEQLLIELNQLLLYTPPAEGEEDPDFTPEETLSNIKNWRVDILQKCITAGGNILRNQLANLGPKAFSKYGQFAIQAGNAPIRNSAGQETTSYDRQIHFGVRLDGTIFSDRGKIGNWRITDEMLAAYKDDIPCRLQFVNHKWTGRIEPYLDAVDLGYSVEDISNLPQGQTEPLLSEIIALDATNGQIRLANSQVVIDGSDGIIYIGARGKDETSGKLQLATHSVVGDSMGANLYSEGIAGNETVTATGTHSGIDGVNPSDQQGYGITDTQQGGNHTSSWSYVVQKLEPTGNEYHHTGNRFSITENINTHTAGIILSNMQNTTETTADDGTTTYVRTGEATSYLYPALTAEGQSGWLGTAEKKWHIYSNWIESDASSIWMGGYLVATQKWVADICAQINANFLALDAAVTAALNRVSSALSQLMKLIRGDWEQGSYVQTGTDDDGNPIYQWQSDGSNPFKLEEYLSGGNSTSAAVTLDLTSAEAVEGTSTINVANATLPYGVKITLSKGIGDYALADFAGITEEDVFNLIKTDVESAFDDWMGGVTPSVSVGTWDSDGGSVTITLTTPAGSSYSFTANVALTINVDTTTYSGNTLYYSGTSYDYSSYKNSEGTAGGKGTNRGSAYSGTHYTAASVGTVTASATIASE